jgi:hypothetical protein
VDLDADGRMDFLSGSYDPGTLHLFRGKGDGTFAAIETLEDRQGRPILKMPESKEAVDSFGSWTAAVDWDDDGDLDLLVGTFEGTLFLRRNLGTREKPSFAAENEWVMVGEKALRVPGGEHCNPVVADWDGDGRWDLVCGAGDGGAYWYRNVGDEGAPRFEPPVSLVPKHEGIGYSEPLEPGQVPKPGIRSQIAVADHDGDGKLDLLLGDFCTYLELKDDLTAEQVAEFRRLYAQDLEDAKYLRGEMERTRAEYRERMEATGLPEAEWGKRGRRCGKSSTRR